jgi:hypothetical protein
VPGSSFTTLGGIQFLAVQLDDTKSPMHRAAISIRCLLATGLVVSALLCCCQGESLGGAFTRLVETGSVFAQDGEGESCCASNEADQQSAPDDDGRPCDCRTRAKAKSLPDAKTTIDLAGAAPIAPILFARLEPTAPMEVGPRALTARVLVRPFSSLLRQHCALIV